MTNHTTRLASDQEQPGKLPQTYRFNDPRNGIFARNFRDLNGLPVSDTCIYILRGHLFGLRSRDWSDEQHRSLTARLTSEQIAHFNSAVSKSLVGCRHISESPFWVRNEENGIFFTPEFRTMLPSVSDAQMVAITNAVGVEQRKVPVSVDQEVAEDIIDDIVNRAERYGFSVKQSNAAECVQETGNLLGYELSDDQIAQLVPRVIARYNGEGDIGQDRKLQAQVQNHVAPEAHADGAITQPYTVLGYYTNNGQLFAHHVEAQSGLHAFTQVAKDHDAAEFTVAIQGHLNEAGGVLVFPGECLVDAATVLEQPDVFGPDYADGHYPDVKEPSRQAQHAAPQVPVVKADPIGARLFWEELMESCESLTELANAHGARTLADLMYLQNSILSGGFIDHYPDESNVVKIVTSLPSSDRWIQYVVTEYLVEADEAPTEEKDEPSPGL